MDSGSDGEQPDDLSWVMMGVLCIECPWSAGEFSPYGAPSLYCGRVTGVWTE